MPSPTDSPKLSWISILGLPGFQMSLAHYLVMDAFVHPLQHILYHALKTSRNDTFMQTLEEAKPLLAWYDPAMDILGSFGDFFPRRGCPLAVLRSGEHPRVSRAHPGPHPAVGFRRRYASRGVSRIAPETPAFVLRASRSGRQDH